MPPVHLSRIESLDDVRAAIREFNATARGSKLARQLSRETSYWVYDAGTQEFGPSKFCGFQGFTLKTYADARSGDYNRLKFDGYFAHKAIERVAGSPFATDLKLRGQLERWAGTLFGKEIFVGIKTSKWRFLGLRATAQAKVEGRSGRSGASLGGGRRSASKGVNHERRAALIWDMLVRAASEGRKITYGALATSAGVHRRVLRWPLELIQNFCLRERLDPLTAIVVHAGDRKPGGGFTAWDVDDLPTAWRRVFSFDWESVRNPFEYARSGESERRLAHRLATDPGSAKVVYQLVRVRGQAQVIFRAALIEAYDGACSFCGLSFVEALEAAHIMPWSRCQVADRMSPLNGILLCSNHHEMFDKGWLRVTDTYQIIYADMERRQRTYGPMDEAFSLELHGKKLRLPRNKKLWPDPERIRQRYSESGR